MTLSREGRWRKMICEFCNTTEGNHWVLDNTKILCSECFELVGIKPSDVKRMSAWLKENKPAEKPEEEKKEFTTAIVNKFNNPSTKF